MTEVVGAVSLMVAAIGMLYSVWYGEILAAMKLKKAPKVADRKKEIEAISTTLVRRARPLFWAAVVLTILVVPDVARILIGSVRQLSRNGPAALLDYEATQASLIAVWAFLLAFALVLRRQCLELMEKLRDFRS